MPSKLHPTPPDAAVNAASISTHAMVASADPNSQMNDKTSDVAPHSGKKHIFTLPYPGVNGVVAGVLDGKQFVLAGVFPKVGGGAELLLGTEQTQLMIQPVGNLPEGYIRNVPLPRVPRD